MEDEMNKSEISNSLLTVFQQSKQAASNSQHSEYYTVRKEFKGNRKTNFRILNKIL